MNDNSAQGFPIDQTWRFTPSPTINHDDQSAKMYPNATELNQNNLMVLARLFPQHRSSQLQAILDRCGGDVIRTVENIMNVHEYHKRLIEKARQLFQTSRSIGPCDLLISSALENTTYDTQYLSDRTRQKSPDIEDDSTQKKLLKFIHKLLFKMDI
ncbi:unnamed protein product [Owenia fusiformis]|nr:unnamed protein product [Owenia fusiformis]